MKSYRKFSRALPVCAVLLIYITGCVSPQGDAGWGARPAGDSGWWDAAKEAATDPEVWVPALTAGVLIAADVDKQWSRDMAEDRSVFGDDALDRSDDLRDLATVAYVATALAAPSASTTDKFRGLGVGAATMILDGVVTEALKRGVSRTRPTGENDRSLPSGHASKAASRTAMALHNLEHIDMPAWSRHASNWALHSVALGAGIARVEGGKHYLADVLLGYATGQLVARFMQNALLAEDGGGALTFAPVAGGGALTLTLPLR